MEIVSNFYSFLIFCLILPPHQYFLFILHYNVINFTNYAMKGFRFLKNCCVKSSSISQTLKCRYYWNWLKKEKYQNDKKWSIFCMFQYLVQLLFNKIWLNTTCRKHSSCRKQAWTLRSTSNRLTKTRDFSLIVFSFFHIFVFKIKPLLTTG